MITPDGSGVTMWFIAGPMIALVCNRHGISIERKERKEIEHLNLKSTVTVDS